MSAPRWLWVKGHAGLGNRLEALATAIPYARLTGRALYVDWSDDGYSHDGSNAFPRLLRCTGFDPDVRPPETDSVAPAVWRGRLGESVFDVGPGLSNLDRHRVTSANAVRLDHPEEVVVYWAFGQEIDKFELPLRERFPELAQRGIAEIMRDTLRQHVALQPALRAEVDAFRRERCPGPTVGVHVRWSDHRSSLPETLVRLDKLLRKRPDLGIFLATDARHVRVLFEARYPRAVTRDHWYPAPGFKIHENPAHPDPVAGAADALIDLQLLIECDAVIADRSSSFGFLALLLSHAPAGAVIKFGRRNKGPLEWARFEHKTLRALGFFSWGPRLVQIREDGRRLGRRLRKRLL